MVTIIGGIKGGTGKSTIATNICSFLVCNGIEQILVDANPGQTTSANWVARRNENLPIINCVEKSGDLRKELKNLNKQYEQVIVDVGGWDSKEFRTSLIVSDLLITPLRASQADLETLTELTEIVEQAAKINDKFEVLIVLNQAPTHSTVKLIDEAKEALKYLRGFVVSLNIIYSRKPFIDALADGVGVVEITNYRWKKAKIEIENLCKEVYK